MTEVVTRDRYVGVLQNYAFWNLSKTFWIKNVYFISFHLFKFY